MSQHNNIILMFLHHIVLSLLLSQTTLCYPIDRAGKPEMSEEVIYPNGSVVGKYTYSDADGHPINVKYFADNTGYGVELSSYKIILPNTKDAQSSLIKNYGSIPVDRLLELASEIKNFKRKQTSAETTQDVPYIKEIAHLSKSVKITSPYYDTYYQNELKAPKQCEKDKVKVYLVKDKRKARSILEDESDAYCGKF